MPADGNRDCPKTQKKVPFGIHLPGLSGLVSRERSSFMKYFIKDEKGKEIAVLEGDYLFAVVGTEEQTESVLLGKTSPKILSRNGSKEIVKQCRTISINDN